MSPAACAVLDEGERERVLACADISLWEIAMLVSKGRLSPGKDSRIFCHLALDARGVRVLPINADIAAASVRLQLPHGDPADRLIAATAHVNDAPLVTADKHLLGCPAIETIW